MSPPDAPRYWLLPGETPVGPYLMEEILSQIQAGTCNWTTKASLVGSQQWTPLNQLLTLAPVASVASGSEPSTVQSATPPSTTPASRPGYFSEGAKFAIFALAAASVIYFFWSISTGNSSLTPQQVCQAMFSAKTITEARKYVTPNLHAALDMLATQPDFGTDENEKLELTSEQPAPLQMGGGYYVGYRFHFPDAGRIATCEGVFHVLNQSGFKVHDWYIFSMNGQTIEPPLSLAREYEFFRNPQSPAVAERQMTDAKKQAQQWHNTNNNNLARAAGFALFKSGLGKGLLVIIGAVIVGIIGFVKNKQSSPSKKS